MELWDLYDINRNLTGKTHESTGDEKLIRQSLEPADKDHFRCKQRISKCILSESKERIPHGHHRMPILPVLR